MSARKGPARSDVKERARRERAWKLGEDLIAQYCHGNARMDRDEAVIWALLCHATRVSKRAWKGPPRSGYPGAAIGAAMVVDEVTVWQKVAAYLRGELDAVDMPEGKQPVPSAAEISACEVTLEVYHAAALRDLGGWKNLRAAVYAQACGMPPRKVHAWTGINRNRLRHARDRAVRDMLDAWKR